MTIENAPLLFVRQLQSREYPRTGYILQQFRTCAPKLLDGGKVLHALG